LESGLCVSTYLLERKIRVNYETSLINGLDTVPCTGLRERLAFINYETFLINSLDMRDCSGSVFLSKLSSCSLALSHTPVCRVLLCYFFSFFCCRCCFPLLIRFVCVCVCVFYSVFVLLVRRKFGMVFCFVLCVQSFCVVSAVSREGGGDANFCN
jgi:hypothetical protein